MLRWYLVQAKPFAECIAQSNLERQGYEVYLPRLLKRVRRHASWREQITALFPRYLFLRLHDGLQSLAPVRSTSGVTRVVRFGQSYAQVPDRVIDELRARADADSGLHRLSQAVLDAGAPVRVTSGPFDGLQGIFEAHAGAERVVILLKLLGRETRVRMSAAFVVAASAPR